MTDKKKRPHRADDEPEEIGFFLNRYDEGIAEEIEAQVDHLRECEGQLLTLAVL